MGVADTAAFLTSLEQQLLRAGSALSDPASVGSFEIVVKGQDPVKLRDVAAIELRKAAGKSKP